MLSDELKELIVLLDYGESAGNICSKTLTEIANKNDLKSIFEEIIKFYLVSSSSSTRINASVTLHKLCRRFSNDLSELLSMSASDGYLLTMTSLNLEHLFQQSDSIELLGGKSFLPGLNDNIHKKSWLRRCRKLLHERLGYESGNIDITAAMEFLDDESNVPLLDPQDIIATTTEYSTDRNGDDDAEENNDHDNDDDEDSSESWIARLVRYMTVGLLDPCWESRHGCALGLVSILTGTLASFSDPSSDMKMARYGVQSGRGLPSFLVEDILCHGLCTLLLDRFVDLGYSSSGASSSGSSGTAVSTSPVKEAVGLLLARVSFLNSTTPSSATTFSEGNESLAYQIFTRLSWIASRGLQITESHASSSSSSSSSLYVSVNESLHKNWVVRQGGLIALKHFVSAHFNTLFLDDVTCAQLRLLCEAGLNDPIDDVQNASLGLFLACCRLGIQTSVASSVGTASVSNLLWSLTDALMHSISSLDPLSVRTVSLFHALTALSAVHPVEEVKFVNIQKKLLTLLRLQNALISRLHLFAASTRRNCLLATTSFLSNTLDLIKLLLDASYKVDTTVLVEMIPMVVSIMMSLLRNLTSEASADLGDLHLTSQWDQEKKSISKQATSTNATSSTVPNSGLDSSSHEVSTSSSVSSSVPSDSDAISLVQTSNSLTNNQTISARLGTLIGKIIVELALNRCHGGTLLSDLVVAVVKDSCSFPDSDTIDSNHTISSNKTEKITVGSKSRKRKQTVEEVPIVESAELTHSSAVQGFILSILSNETVKSDFKTTDLYQLNATNFTGLFPDKLLCQLAEFMSGLISPSPECQAEIEARLIQAADVIISAAVKQDENKSMLEHASVKKPAMIRMQLVQEDDGKMLLDSNTSNTSSGKIKSKVSHRSRVLSILSWLSVSIGQVLSTSISNSDLYLFIQRLRKDWEEDKSAKTGRAIWHGGLLRVFGDVQLNAQVQWVKRAVATTAISASEDTIRAMCDHFSYLFLQVYLFRSSQKPERSRQLNELILPSPGSISILCDLLAIESPGGQLMFQEMFHSFAQEMGSMLLLSHLPPCVRLLCKSEMKEFTSLNAETFIQALRFISIVFPVILEDDECAELLLRSHLVANIMLCGERFNIPANEVALALTKACYHKPSLSEQLWITFLQASYAILSSPDKANSCKIYYATSLSDLTRCVPETDLINTYEHWLRVCLLGVGIYLPTVRQACTTAFRNIIPLSAVVVQTNHLPVVNSHIRSSSGSSGTNSDSVGVLAQVLSRSPLVSIASSTNALDITILRILSILGSSLFTSTSGSGIKDDATAAMPYLRPYQADGVTWLTHLRRCGLAGCLADEMGLGKSAQALVSLTLMRIEQVVNSSQLSVVDLISMNSESLGDIMTTSAASALPCLVICPASVVSHWEAEIRKFIPPSIFSPVKFTGKDIKLDGSSIVIVSYDQLRTHINKFLFVPGPSDTKSKERVWAAVVIDEAHLVKNPISKTAQCVFQLKSNFRIAISGTPIQNNLEELWSVMNFLLPDFLGPHKSFMKTVARPVQQSMLERRKLLSLEAVQTREKERVEGKRKSDDRKQSIAAEGLGILRKFHKQVLPFILCRTKAVVAADIPAKTIIDVFCPLSDAQRQLYTEFLSDSRWTDGTLETEFRALAGETVSDVEVVTKALSARKVHPFQALHYLKLLCIHPSLVIESQHSGYRQRLVDELASSTKMLHLADLLVKSGIVSRDEASESFDQLLTILQASLMGEKISGSAQNSAFSRHSDDEDDDEEEEGSKSEDDSRDGNVGDKNAQQSAQENDNSTKQLNRSQATTRSTVKDAVHKACKDSKPRSKPILKAKLTSEKVIEKSSTSCELIFAHKCLIFSTHKAVLDIVQTTVLKRYFSSVKYARLDGSVSPQQRSQLVDQFNDRSSDIRILLLTKSCCGLGLNLVGADTVIFVEHDFNPFVDLQAMDRAHRIGQDRPVTVYRIIGMETIEARIMSLQSFKRDIVSEIVSERNAHSFTALTGDSTTSAQESSGHFEGALWGSVKAHAVGSSDGSSGVSRYASRNHTYQQWMHEEYEDVDLSKFIKSISSE